MTTATPQQQPLVLHEEHHGYQIFRSFVSRSGTSRVCNAQQGWRVSHPRCERGREIGYTSTLQQARQQIDDAHKMAHDRVALQRTDWTEKLALHLDLVFPDAPNPKIILQRFADSEVWKAEQEAKAAAEREAQAVKDAAAKKLADVAPEMLAVLRRLEWSGRQLEAGVSRCPVCGQTERNPHTPACALGDVIAKATGAQS